jgi:phage shock protein A
MNPIKRLAATLHINIDNFLDQVENHEAVANCALREIQKAAGKARAQYHRVKSDSEKVSQRLLELEQEKVRWMERARKSHGEDETKALECIRRLKVAEREMAHLEEQKKNNAQLEQQLCRDLQRIEEQVGGLRRKRNQLMSREATAQALGAIDRLDSKSIGDIDDLFERWETKIAGYEGTTGPACKADEFEAGFAREEEQVQLKASLDEILNTK